MGDTDAKELRREVETINFKLCLFSFFSVRVVFFSAKGIKLAADVLIIRTNNFSASGSIGVVIN
jgi:hypothetical protein